MDIRTIMHGARSGCMTVPASKSWAHRMLITAALSESSCEISCDGISKDISATIKCLNAVGANICMSEPDVKMSAVKNQENSSEDNIALSTVIKVIPVKITVDHSGQSALYVHLFCGESGSTLRFMIPVVGALGINAAFHMEGRLSERPLEPLTGVLSEHGMSFRKDGQILYCTGKLSGGVFSIPGNISSQYISGLLMALPLLNEDSIIEITGQIESGDYIEMTVRAVEEAGIKLIREGNTYHIEGKQNYKVQERMTVEKDWSSASFPLCMGAFSPDGVTVDGLNMNSVQGDKEIVNILDGFGASITIEESDHRSISLQEYLKNEDAGKESSELVSITVKKDSLKGQVIDASRIPDLVPVIAVVAAGALGETRIIHAERLRLKESDRLETTAAMLKALGADIEVTEDGLLINGGNSENDRSQNSPMLTGGTVDSFNDHRIAMSAAVAAGICTAPVTVTGAECTDKSFPGFWDEIQRI